MQLQRFPAESHFVLTLLNLSRLFSTRSLRGYAFKPQSIRVASSHAVFPQRSKNADRRGARCAVASNAVRALCARCAIT